MASRRCKKLIFSGALTLATLLVFGHKIESWFHYSGTMEPMALSVSKPGVGPETRGGGGEGGGKGTE